MAREIAITATGIYGWSGPWRALRAPADDLRADVRKKRYVGTYVVAERGIEFDVEVEDRGLALSWEGHRALVDSKFLMWRTDGAYGARWMGRKWS